MVGQLDLACIKVLPILHRVSTLLGANLGPLVRFVKVMTR
jgi:hypothetical protein